MAKRHSTLRTGLVLIRDGKGEEASVCLFCCQRQREGHVHSLFQGGSFPQHFSDFLLANSRSKSALESYFHYFGTRDSAGWKASLRSVPGVCPARCALRWPQVLTRRCACGRQGSGLPHTPGPTSFKGARSGYLCHSPLTSRSCWGYLRLPECGRSPGGERAQPPRRGPGLTELTHALHIRVMDTRVEW